MMPLLVAATLTKIAVLNLSATGVESNLAENLSEVLVTEVSSLGRYQVIGKSDISAMLGFEAQKQLLSCEAESCVAEIGGALGVSLIVVGNIGKLEDLYLLNLKVIDMSNASVKARVSEQVEGKAKELIAALKRQVPILFAKAKGTAPAAVVPPAPTPVAVAPQVPPEALAPAPESNGSALRWAAWGGVGLGVVGVVVGSVLRGQMNEAHTRYSNAIVVDEINAARTETETKGNQAFLTFVGAGLVAIAGGVGLVVLP